jgi:hypothetical protein
MSKPATATRARAGFALSAGLIAPVMALAGCGSTSAPAGSASTRSASGITAPALATSLAVPGGASWAVIPMGGSAARHDNFWELLVRPAGDAGWKLVTPAGVASNGGLIMTATGPGSLLTGFRPSQQLTFSPLAATTDAGANWSQNDVLDAGLADVPGALASGPGGRLLAISGTGDIDLGTRGGASWARLTTARALARTAAGRACDLTTLTGAAWTPAGQPLLAGNCRTAGTAAIFVLRAGSWQPTGPSVPAALHRRPVSVIGLNAAGPRITAILAAGAGRSTAVLAAWSADNGSTWMISPPLSTGATAGAPSISFGADGSASLLLPASHAVSGGAVIGWRAAAWQSLPRLPAGASTLATTTAGQPEVLAVQRGTLTAWQLSGSRGQSAWTLLQTVKVTIPYGSSG